MLTVFVGEHSIIDGDCDLSRSPISRCSSCVGEHSIIDGDCDLRDDNTSLLRRVGEHSIIDGDCDKYFLEIPLLLLSRRAFHNWRGLRQGLQPVKRAEKIVGAHSIIDGDCDLVIPHLFYQKRVPPKLATLRRILPQQPGLCACPVWVPFRYSSIPFLRALIPLFPKKIPIFTPTTLHPCCNNYPSANKTSPIYVS